MTNETLTQANKLSEQINLLRKVADFYSNKTLKSPTKDEVLFALEVLGRDKIHALFTEKANELQTLFNAL